MLPYSHILRFLDECSINILLSLFGRMPNGNDPLTRIIIPCPYGNSLLNGLPTFPHSGWVGAQSTKKSLNHKIQACC